MWMFLRNTFQRTEPARKRKTIEIPMKALMGIYVSRARTRSPFVILMALGILVKQNESIYLANITCRDGLGLSQTDNRRTILETAKFI